MSFEKDKDSKDNSFVESFKFSFGPSVSGETNKPTLSPTDTSPPNNYVFSSSTAPHTKPSTFSEPQGLKPFGTFGNSDDNDVLTKSNPPGFGTQDTKKTQKKVKTVFGQDTLTKFDAPDPSSKLTWSNPVVSGSPTGSTTGSTTGFFSFGPPSQPSTNPGNPSNPFSSSTPPISWGPTPKSFISEKTPTPITKTPNVWTTTFDHTLSILMTSMGDLDRIAECFLDKNGKEIFTKEEIQSRINHLRGTVSNSSFTIQSQPSEIKASYTNPFFTHKTADGFIVTNEGQAHPIHKNVVSLTSPFLKEEFYGKKQDSVILNVSADVLRVLLDVLYQSGKEINETKPRKLITLYNAYLLLGMDVTKFEAMIQSKCTLDSLDVVWNWVTLHGLDDSVCVRVLELNLGTIIKDEYFKTYTEDFVFQIEKKTISPMRLYLLIRYGWTKYRVNHQDLYKFFAKLCQIKDFHKYLGKMKKFVMDNLEDFDQKQLKDLYSDILNEMEQEFKVKE